MLWLILGLLAIWAIKIIFNVWWAVVNFLSELIKGLLLCWLIWAIALASEWNWLPIILIIWLPIAWIIYVIYYARKRINSKRSIDKKEKKKVILEDSDFVDVIDSI